MNLIDRDAEMAAEDAVFHDVMGRLKYLALRSARALALAVVAIWLSASQAHVDYPEIAVGILVLVLGSLNRFNWLAGIIVLWLIGLFLVTPELLSTIRPLLQGR